MRDDIIIFKINLNLIIFKFILNYIFKDLKKFKPYKIVFIEFFIITGTKNIDTT